jgi:hypothetical protein
MSVIKRIISSLVQNDAIWLLMEPFAKLGTFMMAIRNRKNNNTIARQMKEEQDRLFSHIFTARKVLHGPFKGVLYPELNSIGSTLYPKLIGSYESELHKVIERVSSITYSEIINIGCGEGYYAIGLARRIPMAKVYAYDIDSKARSLCQEMAILNNVSDRIIINSMFTSQDLENFQFSGRALIVCDCEGFELELFKQDTISILENHDLLIETHDFINISISTRLSLLFSRTHHVHVIKSVDDIEKAKTYRYPEAADMDLLIRNRLFGERRPAIMEWLFLTPKN